MQNRAGLPGILLDRLRRFLPALLQCFNDVLADCAVYLVVPEILLGLNTYLAYRYSKYKPLAIKLCFAANVMTRILFVDLR